MVTTEVFENLKKLQDVLVRKYALEAKVADAPKQLSTHEELLARLQKEFIAKNAEFETVRGKVVSLHFDLDEAIKSKDAGEKGMDNITTHREYEALDKQISEASAREAEIRKELQKEEKNQAELDESLKGLESMIKSQEAELAESKQNLDKQIDTYNSQLEQLRKQEAEIAPNLDQEILFKFQRIIQRNSEGIVAVHKNVCTGCHMILPAQFANTVRDGENIIFCPYCSRILYYESTGDAQDDYYNLDDIGSLVGLDYDDDEYEDSDEYDDDSQYDDENALDEDSEDASDEDEDSDSDSDSDDDNED